MQTAVNDVSVHTTNTLIVPALPPSFFDPLVLQALRDLFTSYGALHSWAPLRGLGRIILVYYDIRHAEEAKAGTDGLELGHDSEGPGFVLRVYRGAPTPTQAIQPSTLAVPALEKNFLISPPGSPPVGWEPVVEDPPNKDALAADLMEALRRLQLSREGGVEVLVSPNEQGVPAVHLEGEWAEGDSVPGIGMVKATVASMGGSGVATPVGSGWLDGERVSVQKIPTARPPLPDCWLSGIGVIIYPLRCPTTARVEWIGRSERTLSQLNSHVIMEPESPPSTPAQLKLEIPSLSPVKFPSTHSLHRLPTPDPSRTRTYTSSLGSDLSSALSPDDPMGTETVRNSPETKLKLGALHLDTHNRLAPPSTRISPLPSPSESNRRLGSPSRPSPPDTFSPSDDSPRSTTSKTSAFFGSAFAEPTPAPPAPLSKSKSISRLQPSRSNDPSSFAFNSGVGGANVNRSASDRQRRGTANDSFFSQSAATLTPAPPPSLSRRPSTKNRSSTPESAGSREVASPERRLPPRERFFPSRANVDRRDQWEEATGLSYGSPPGTFGSTTSLNGLWENQRWGGSQASTGWSGGSSRGVSPARPETRGFVELEDGGQPTIDQLAETAKDKDKPTRAALLAANENTPRPGVTSLPTPVSLTPVKKPVRSANAAGARRPPSHLHREHSHLHPTSVPRPPSPQANEHLCDADVKLRLIRPLGVGAFSCVWLAEDEEGSLATDRRAHSTSEAKRRRDRRMHGLRPSATGTRDLIGDEINGDAARGREIARQASPFLVERSPVAATVGAPGRLVAVKMMDRALCDVNDRTRISFVREVEVLRHISHPSVVAYLHSFTTPTHHCLVVEHIGGGELFELINMEENRNKMTEPLLRRLWGELCRAVGWMHSVALVHRDIKLENILLTSNPFINPVPPLTTPLLKLTDFGLSRFIDPAHPELTTRCGSEEYAAPEIIMGSPYDGRETDAWACGVVLFALGTGVLPFSDSAASPAPSNHSSHSPLGQSQRRSYLLRIAQCQYDPRGLSEGARRIVGKLLVRTPAKRAKIAELWSDPWMRGAGAPHPPPGMDIEDGAAFLVDKESIDSVAREEIPIAED